MSIKYIAGPRWRPAPGDDRKPGDLIEEAPTWPHLHGLLGRLELDIAPEGKWVYVAGRNYKPDRGDMRVPGDRVPEAADWLHLDSAVKHGEIERIDMPKRSRGKKAKKVLS